jgi:hypothetical protein
MTNLTAKKKARRGGEVSPVYATAIGAHDAGLCVLPVKPDGTKAPDVASWKSFQTTRPGREEIDHWFGDGRRTGLGYVTGAVSGNLELLDFDDPSTYEEFSVLAESAGLKPVLDRIRNGYLEQSPGGVHLLYRCETITGNTKLARHVDDAGVIHVDIETRGEGGFMVASPSNGRVHPSGGSYQLVSGGVASIATISPEERDELHALARSLDAMPKTPPRDHHGATSAEGSGRPGDDYNQRCDAVTLLESHGWTVVFEHKGQLHLRRPGKVQGTSATFATINGKPYFYVFTTSTQFESERAYSPFAVYTTLEHGGDFAEAARALAAQGYGAAAVSIGQGGQRTIEDPGQQWPEMDPAAMHGLVGDIVEAVSPHTEADPAGILINLLVQFGAVIGRSPHTPVGATRHGVNLYAVTVGQSSRSRKGTAGNEVRRIIDEADPSFRARIMGGLSSGEGLIYAVRDPIWQPDRKTGEMKIVDSGVDDKRLLVVETEFSSALRVMTREGNTLSEQIRRGWDGDDLRSMTKNSPLSASKPHIAMIGHITQPELMRELSETNQLNGFANRFLFAVVRRSQLLPDGGALDESTLYGLAERVEQAVQAARLRGELRRDPEAAEMWHAVYPMLTAERPGMFGAITARAEAHVLRLSLLYALLDDAPAIERPHLAAALAVWEYAEASARFIFGDATGNPIADQILTALRRNGRMTQTQISDLFGRNQKAGRLEQALTELLRAGRVRTWQGEAASGRPPAYWEAV